MARVSSLGLYASPVMTANGSFVGKSQVVGSKNSALTTAIRIGLSIVLSLGIWT